MNREPFRCALPRGECELFWAAAVAAHQARLAWEMSRKKTKAGAGTPAGKGDLNL